MFESNFIKSLVKPNAKAQGRKVWGVDLNTVWLPFFTATNAMNETTISVEAIGCPLRLATNPDGSVKFSKSGKPIIRVEKQLAENVRLVRENFIAGLQGYTEDVFTNHAEAYQEMVDLCKVAGKPIAEVDRVKLDKAMQNIVNEALEHAEAREAEARETVSV